MVVIIISRQVLHFCLVGFTMILTLVAVVNIVSLVLGYYFVHKFQNLTEVLINIILIIQSQKLPYHFLACLLRSHHLNCFMWFFSFLLEWLYGCYSCFFFSFSVALHIAKPHVISFPFLRQIYVLLGILGGNRGMLVSVEE